MTLWEFQTENYDFIYFSPVIGANGSIYIGSEGMKFYAISSDPCGLANSPWPMFHHNVRHTGNTQGFAQNSNSSTFKDEFDDGDKAPGRAISAHRIHSVFFRSDKWQPAEFR